MIRVLSMIAIAGFFLAVVCLSIAAGLAGPDAITRGAWSWNGHGWHVRAGDGPEATKMLPWTGEAAEIDVPAEVSFVQADGPAKLVIRGPRSSLDHVVVQDGRIGFDRASYDGEELRIELTAPKVTRFALNGSGRLDLSGYRQDTLDISLAGDGEVSARGAAKSVNLEISGSGNGDLSGLAVEGADVRISGSGDAKVAPRTWAKLDISGSGDVTLIGHPAQLESHVSGSGQILQDETSNPAQPQSPETPKPSKPAKSAHAT